MFKPSCTAVIAVGLSVNIALAATSRVSCQDSAAPPAAKLRMTGRQGYGTGWGDGRAFDGTRLAFNEYEALDGMPVNVTSGTFASPQAARTQLTLWLGADPFIERGPKKDPSGMPVGERVVAEYTIRTPYEESVAIYWTNGATYYLVTSPSRELALEVERALDSHSFNHMLRARFRKGWGPNFPSPLLARATTRPLR